MLGQFKVPGKNYCSTVNSKHALYMFSHLHQVKLTLDSVANMSVKSRAEHPDSSGAPEYNPVFCDVRVDHF